MIEVRCLHCGLCVLVPEIVRGKSGVCFACGAKLEVPLSAETHQPKEIAFRQGDQVSGRYVVKERIGGGGIGVVYRAMDTLMNEVVALKFMKPQKLSTQKGQRLFVKEAQVARRLRHENIVAVHDVSTTVEGILYISIELLEGQSLRTFLSRHRKARKLVDIRMAVAMTSQILAGLAYAHRTVIHRDIKPENVMLLSGERVKVLDFGLAKAVEQNAVQTPGQSGAAKSKRVVGTLAYASPEQVRRRGADQRADLYAVGLVFRELLTLRTPVEEQIEIPDLRNDASPSILNVLYKALEHDREDRWQTAAEFLGGLSDAFERSYRPVLVQERTSGGVEVSTEGMVFLEGGSFLMGNKGVAEESPEFETFVDPFYMDATPVTVEQYACYLEASGAPEPKLWNHAELSGPTQPVIGVSWHEANAYAAWAGKQLPSEKEWEFAARGKENRPYPWGTVKPDPTCCNFRDYLGMPSIVTMHEEGTTPDNIKDLAGNVFEWTLDPFVPYDIPVEKAADVPQRVVRGGSWHSGPDEVRCTFRKGLFPETQLTTVGFRCVVPARPEWRSPTGD